MNLKKATVVVLLLANLIVSGCANKRVVTQDYLNGFRTGQIASVSNTYAFGLISGANACKALKNGLNGLDEKKEVVNPDAFEGCVAGFDAGLTGKAPKLGDKLK
jgi:hypothetical protein